MVEPRWTNPGSSPFAIGRRIKDETTFMKNDWVLSDLDGQEKTLQPGNYEYPFEIVFPGSSAESIEGLSDAWIVYRLKATIERGRLAQNVYARRHIRVVRTLDPTNLELTTSAFIPGAWKGKVNYNIGTMSKAVMLGTPIHFEILLTPLLKGLTISRIFVQLAELQDFELTTKSYQHKRAVTYMDYDANDAVDTLDEEGQDAWLIKKSIDLPTSLVDCMQDVDHMGIAIKHRLEIFVNFVNPDGHISIVSSQW